MLHTVEAHVIRMSFLGALLLAAGFVPNFSFVREPNQGKPVQHLHQL
jgi:hypothetical protein